MSNSSTIAESRTDTTRPLRAPAALQPPPPEGTLQVRRWIEVAFRLAPIVVLSTLAAAGTAAAVSSRQPPRYEAGASILLYFTDPSASLVRDYVQEPNDPDRLVVAQVDVVTSPGVLSRAAATLGDVTVSQLREHIDVRPGTAADTLFVRGSAGDPRRAEAITAAVAQAYVANRREAASATLDDAIAEIEERLKDLERRSTQGGTELERQAAHGEYQRLFSQREELAVRSAIQRGAAEIIAAPERPTHPVSPQPVRAALLGGFAGLIAGCALALLRLQFDGRVRTLAEVAGSSPVPVLGAVPASPSSFTPHLPLKTTGRSLRLAARLQTLATGTDLRRLAIIGLESAAGAQVMARALAAALEAGGRSAAIDAVAGQAMGSRTDAVSIAVPPPLAVSLEALDQAAAADAVCVVAVAGRTQREDLLNSVQDLDRLAPGRVSIALLMPTRMGRGRLRPSRPRTRS